MSKGPFRLTKLLKRRKITSDTKINEKQKAKNRCGGKNIGGKEINQRSWNPDGNNKSSI